MKRASTYVALAVALVAGLYVYNLLSLQPASPLSTIQLDDQAIRVTIVETQGARERGLSGRAGLAADEGMLFIFPQEGKYAFWMKDMRFAIDILWLSPDGSIVYMAQNVSPDTYPQAFKPNTLARYVLELPAGYVHEHSVEVGDMVKF